ncbi:hypothetical protein GFC29_786 [Anoxybacillus sp. B7M1]|jgi:hypothetical protein|nr:hypothetical protein GFC28_840 [Anoxybacillus sp. B2M1]ANB62860.1 hypothetical protein GFC29_786 [Anoxybacillus sp. B7M1]
MTPMLPSPMNRIERIHKETIGRSINTNFSNVKKINPIPNKRIAFLSRIVPKTTLPAAKAAQLNDNNIGSLSNIAAQSERKERHAVPI